MNTKLFLLHRSHPSDEKEFFNQSLNIRVEKDTPENLECLQESMKHLCGSCVIIRGKIIDIKVK